MHPIGRLRPVSLILVVTLLPLMSSVAAFFCTQRYGMGITPDSITYLYAAKCIALGKGFGILTASGEPMLLYTFAPFLSVSLSPLFWLNADLMICLRLFYGLLFILTNLCYGWIVYRMTGRTLYAFLLQIALCLDPSWQSLYVWILTEPLYNAFTALAMVLLCECLDRPGYKRLAVTAVLIGLASLTRYIGFANIALGCLALIILLPEPIKKRIPRVIAFGLTSSSFLCLWYLRNYNYFTHDYKSSAVIPNVTAGYHFVELTGAAWVFLRDHFSGMVPSGSVTFTVCVAAAAGLAVRGIFLRHQPRPFKIFFLVLAAWNLIYMGTLVSIYGVSHSNKFEETSRLFSPILPSCWCLLVLCLYGILDLVRRWKRPAKRSVALVLICLAVWGCVPLGIAKIKWLRSIADNSVDVSLGSRWTYYQKAPYPFARAKARTS